MQFVVVTIRRESAQNRPRMKYPSVYDAEVVERNRQGPILYDGGLAEGAATEEALLYVTDEQAASLSMDPDVRTITRTEADAWIAACPKLANAPEEQVRDPNRLLAIQTKLLASVALSQEDRDALDPDKATFGINRKTKNTNGYFGLP